ncbi:MAG: tRNA (adenosine(37)-N6)-threonylcarbamoyltransferase complex dimerization subunit type 1 TsaB [Oscillospiraceae bacterium]|nr:tRNA (adenosine(37)-N6)-threonylcarbamoyltransferase complex dimerization subunit type 1 TsaB [Oscillospiraceae bacterium]
MKSLAIDTCAKTVSVAIFEDDKLIAESFFNTGFTYSQTLLPIIDFCLDISKTNISEIKEFIVVSGPGSFTGLRIGIATIKGLAVSKNLKNLNCKAVSTIETLAYNLRNYSFLNYNKDLRVIICPAMDARCNQVYTGIFELVDNKIIRLEKDLAISIDELEIKLKKFENEFIFLLGDGANLCYNIFKNSFKNINLVSEDLLYPKASSLFWAAKDKSYISSADLKPVYLRLSQAQRQILEKNKN